MARDTWDWYVSHRGSTYGPFGTHADANSWAMAILNWRDYGFTVFQGESSDATPICTGHSKGRGSRIPGYEDSSMD